MKAELEEGAVTIAVTNNAPWQPPQPSTDERGRGLTLIAALVNDIDIQTDAHRTTLRMVKYL